MITCSVCGTENGDLAVVCSSCKSYIQSKVDNLNLFETFWGLMETPRGTFKRIVLARHKNYVLFLSAMLGVSFVYAAIWFENWGHLFSNVITLAGLGLLFGVPVGIAGVIVVSSVVMVVARMLGGSPSLRNMIAVVAYAGMPVVLALVFVVPVEIAVFGRYFFDNNPPPLVISPVIYVVLIGLHGAAWFWSWLLLVEGTVVAGTLGRLKSALAGLAIAGVTGCAAYVSRFL